MKTSFWTVLVAASLAAAKVPAECPCTETTVPDATIDAVLAAVGRELTAEECNVLCDPELAQDAELAEEAGLGSDAHIVLDAPALDSDASLILPISTVLPDHPAATAGYAAAGSDDRALFDPIEPRPNLLFDAPHNPLEVLVVLRPPPMAESRLEKLSPFEGAKAHEPLTPFPPDAESLEEQRLRRCSTASRAARAAASVVVVAVGLGLLVLALERTLSGCVRLCRRGRRGSVPTPRIVVEKPYHDEV